tara:strand:- start:13696 stop:13884 length:189 start_codon:yes stop_codon:yes gene_type:complete
MSHYHPDDFEHLKVVDNSHYTAQMWFDEIRVYLIDVMGMNEQQVINEFKSHFPELMKELQND